MTMKQQMQSSAYPLKYADVRKLIVAPSTTDTHRLLGAAGRDQATRDAAKALFERRPDYSCEVARDDFFFMDDPEHLELYLDGLRKAGIPEHSPKERT